MPEDVQGGTLASVEEKVWTAYLNVFPYLAHPAELRESISRHCGGGLEVLKRELEKKMEALDETRRTDLRIFLNELKRLTGTTR